MSKKSVAIVTGSSSGIGKATAIRLAKDGFHIWVHYNNNEAGAGDCLNEIEKAGGSGILWRANMRDLEALEESVEEVWRQQDCPDVAVLVNNAGIHEDNLAGLMSIESFDKVLKTNTYGPFVLMKWCARKMMKQRNGSIVNVASLAGQVGNPGQINYSASKAALLGMTRTLAMEIGARNVRVNAVAPGLIETEMLEGIPQIEMMKQRIPLGRLGKVEEVAGAISFLCSKDASYITGNTISINGGILTT